MASATFGLVRQLANSLTDAERAQLLAQLAPGPEDAAPEGARANAAQMPGGRPWAGQSEVETIPADSLPASSNGAPDGPFITALAAMAAAADAGSEGDYLAAYRTVNWDKADAATFEAAIHLAFTAGAHMAARLLATKGATLHPDNDYLRRAAYVLAPPKVIGREPASDNGSTANRGWMKANRAAYLGQWVALRNGELLGNGPHLKELVDQFGAVPEILYTRVT